MAPEDATRTAGERPAAPAFARAPLAPDAWPGLAFARLLLLPWTQVCLWPAVLLPPRTSPPHGEPPR